MDPNSNMGVYGAVTNANYSPSNAFTFPPTAEDSYFTDSYDLSPMGFFDCDSYFPAVDESTFSPTDLTRSSWPPPATTTTAFLPPTPASAGPPFSQTTSPTSPTFPFGHLDSATTGFTFTPRSPPPPPAESPATTTSTTPSSRRPSLKRDPTDPESTPSAAPHPPRKRGRPRLSQPDPPGEPPSDPPTSSSANTNPTKARRLPHNQVERKYRENLNAEMERLRRAIPSLAAQGAEPGAIGSPKMSKAMVLAGAIDYIRGLERERDEYREEVERLREMLRRGNGGG